MQKQFYVYSHWVVGSDKPFYIGMSTKKKFGNIYARAYRTPFATTKYTNWREYAKQVPFYAVIEKEFYKRKDAFDKEKELIKKWGRIDTGEGCLINQTDGGPGIINATASILKKQLETRKLRFDSDRIKQSRLPYSITVHKYDIMGHFIETYCSASEAARMNNTLTSDVCMAIKGLKKVVSGFQWRTYKDLNGIGLPEAKKSIEKPVAQKDFISKATINTYTSAVHASKETGISRSGIANVLVGISKTAGGYIWDYI